MIEVILDTLPSEIAGRRQTIVPLTESNAVMLPSSVIPGTAEPVPHCPVIQLSERVIGTGIPTAMTEPGSA
jgi:hypothetical protein